MNTSYITSVRQTTRIARTPVEVGFIDEARAKVRLTELAAKHSKLLHKLAKV